MFAGFRSALRRHPILRDVLLWCIPALLIGGFLRGLLLSYQPYGYWGSDSKSYYSFAHLLLGHGDISLDEKRRYLYPLLMAPVSLLPGAPLKWLAWLQHVAGLCAVLPLAYVVRKSFVAWRWWIIPVSVAYVSLPIFLWYEHELLGETLFFVSLAWAFGGWVAWSSQADPQRARRLFWWFFIPLAAFILTKPAGRFVLPGLAFALLTVRAWRTLRWRHWTALILLCGVSLTVGSKKQGAWLLYVSTFPLTQLDTPLHAEYKAELRDYTQAFIDNIDVYYRANKRGLEGRVAPFDFLESPSQENAPPLWAALDKDTKKKRQIYTDLALEGIRARPDLWLRLGLHRVIASANLSEFGEERFASGYYPEKLEDLYADAMRTLEKGKRTSIPMAFGLGRKGALPPYAEFAPRLTPAPGGWAERTLTAWVTAIHGASDVVDIPRLEEESDRISGGVAEARLTPFGWWCLAALALSVFYWRSLGVWMVVAVSYLAFIFLLTHVHTRFFAPAWLIALPMLVAPLDLLARAFRRRTKIGD